MEGSIYVNNESKALVQIGPVDEEFAQQIVLTGPARGGSYKIPIAEYDSVFVQRFRPAGPDDLIALSPEVRPPANATPDWLAQGGTPNLAAARARIEAALEGARSQSSPLAAGLQVALDLLAE